MKRDPLSKVDPDLVIQEAMYGFIMALTLVTTAQMGLIQYETRTDLALAIIGMDFVWAVIDMYIFYRVDIMAMRRRIHLYEKIRSTSDREQKLGLLDGEFEDTVFDFASQEDRRKMAEVFLDGNFSGYETLRNNKRHYAFNAVTAFMAAFMGVIPSVVCLYLIDDYTSALFWSAITSTVALFFIGYKMSPNETKKFRLLTGFTTAAISLLFTLFAAYFGG